MYFDWGWLWSLQSRAWCRRIAMSSLNTALLQNRILSQKKKKGRKRWGKEKEDGEGEGERGRGKREREEKERRKEGSARKTEKKKKHVFFFLFFTFLHCFLLLCRSHSCSIFHLTWPFSIRFSLIFFVYSFTHFLLHASIRIVALYIHTPEKSLWTSPEHLSHKCPALICANRAGPFMTLGTLPDWFFFSA